MSILAIFRLHDTNAYQDNLRIWAISWSSDNMVGVYLDTRACVDIFLRISIHLCNYPVLLCIYIYSYTLISTKTVNTFHLLQHMCQTHSIAATKIKQPISSNVTVPRQSWASYDQWSGETSGSSSHRCAYRPRCLTRMATYAIASLLRWWFNDPCSLWFVGGLHPLSIPFQDMKDSSCEPCSPN